MIRNQKLRVGLRTMRFGLVERWHDLVNVTLPILIVSGLLAGSARLWFWLFGFEAMLACSR